MKRNFKNITLTAGGFFAISTTQTIPDKLILKGNLENPKTLAQVI